MNEKIDIFSAKMISPAKVKCKDLDYAKHCTLIYLLFFYFAFLVKIRCFNIDKAFFSSSKYFFDEYCSDLLKVVMAKRHRFFC